MNNNDLDEHRKWVRLHESNAHQAEAARRITILLDELEQLRALVPKCACGPWHPDMDGPDEECPQHGRSYREWIDRGDRLAAALDRVRKAAYGTEDEVGALELDRPYRDGTDYQDGFANGYALAESIIRAAIEGTDS